MKHHIPWPDKVSDAPVYIRQGGGVEEILEDGYITSMLKVRGVTTVGVMLDADENPEGRYTTIRQRCGTMFPAMPDRIPPAGLISENDDGKRLGVWIMPDNQSEGCLETFLKLLIPDSNEPTWTHALASVVSARQLGATCRDCHLPKANLYTWLAWQDPPGQRAGEALTRKILDPQSPGAEPFVRWFRELYVL